MYYFFVTDLFDISTGTDVMERLKYKIPRPGIDKFRLIILVLCSFF